MAAVVDQRLWAKDEMNFVLEYYQPAFVLLLQRVQDRANEALHTDPIAVRATFLTRHLPINEEVSAESAWPIARQLLDALEAKMAGILENHSVFFWFHIYRRIGVFLSPLHEDKKDPRTLGLVRSIVELAISKHGQANVASEFARSDRINPDRILGGYMRAGIKRLATKQPNKAYRRFTELLRARPQWVIRNFCEDDFLAIYRVEGLAYQYWRVTALLRSLGKGAKIIISRDGDWEYVPDQELTWLLRSIDDRTDRGGSENSLLGVWIDKNFRAEEATRNDLSDTIICPTYNFHRLKPSDAFTGLGVVFPPDFVSNFLPIPVHINKFIVAHEFLTDRFSQHYGYSLSAIALVLWAIGNILYFPRSVLEANENFDNSFKDIFLNLLQRGYRVLSIDAAHLKSEIKLRIDTFAPDRGVTYDDIEDVLKRITLTPETQSSISLWSGGPQFMLMPAGQHHGIFLQGIPVFLATIFVRLSHNQTERGVIFEDAFRRALSERGFEVKRGLLQSLGEKNRELDAGVVIGTVCFLFECVSIERPLDYEIGNPATFRRRRERLDAKVSQAFGLAEFLRGEPRGTNYEFTSVREFVPVIVSPFEEWVWDKSDRLWLSERTPRILSAREALDMLLEVRESESLRKESSP